jgi:hypothetical protein
MLDFLLKNVTPSDEPRQDDLLDNPVKLLQVKRWENVAYGEVVLPDRKLKFFLKTWQKAEQR